MLKLDSTHRLQAIMPRVIRAADCIAYTPYGYTAPRTDQGLLKFNGQFRDSLTGLYILGNGYRGYSGVLLRFLSPDTFSPFGKGGMNGYAYCGGDPINYIDPAGKFRLWGAKIKFAGDYQVLYKGEGARGPSVFHKEVFKSGNAGFVTHSYANVGAKLLNEKGDLVAAKSVAKKEILPRLNALQSYRDDPDKPIYLIACFAGSNGAAQEVANILKRPVISYLNITNPPRADFINLAPADNPSLGMQELPPIPYKERPAVPHLLNPVSRVRRS